MSGHGSGASAVAPPPQTLWVGPQRQGQGLIAEGVELDVEWSAAKESTEWPPAAQDTILPTPETQGEHESGANSKHHASQQGPFQPKR